MSEFVGLRLTVAYVIHVGSMEATIDMGAKRVRFVQRDELGLTRGTCEMALAQWSSITDAMAEVAARLAESDAEPES